MSEPRPCKEFVVPTPEQKYGAYCGRCHYSRESHEKWDEWTEDARRAIATAAAVALGGEQVRDGSRER